MAADNEEPAMISPPLMGPATATRSAPIAINSESTVLIDALDSIQHRVLWLAVRMVDHANRRAPTEVKIGGHQASSASMVSIMTALWFAHIGRDDKVAVKPHASPVYHAIKYLTGELDRSYLTQLRQRGGLQAYPSRTKDPDVTDFSTGSVGLGAVAPLFSAAVRRYVDSHFDPRPPSRFIAIAGDAELDEGNVWEAIADPALQGLGNVTLIVDLNRQSLDRVVPGIKAARLQRFFDNAGWHVEEAKYGSLLERAFEAPGGEVLRHHIDQMPNEEYQSLFKARGTELRERFLAGADRAVERFLHDLPEPDLRSLVLNLGGHDLGLLLDRFRRCDRVVDRPSVVFAYTIKGWGLPIAGDPLNHAALLTSEQIDQLRDSVCLTEADEWERFDPDSAEGRLCGEVGREINNPPPQSRPRVEIPTSTGAHFGSEVSTQEAFGRIMVELGKLPVAKRLVTTAPDVAISTNLGGWINSKGVFSHEASPDFSADSSLLKWKPGPKGQHIELGISEMNLFLLLGQLGLAHEHHGEMLLPVGTVYDPFVLRGLDALIYSLYNAARFVVIGTPAGITLAPEGGAHQSSITPSVGVELPGIVAWEPAFGRALDWILTHALRRVADESGWSSYIRCSTRPIDQSPFEACATRLGEEQLRMKVLSGAYRLREPAAGVPLIIVACGPVMPEVLEAAELLQGEGVGVTVIDIVSQDLLMAAWRGEMKDAASNARRAGRIEVLEDLILPAERAAPILTVQDASSHSLAWLGSVFGQPVVPVGVDDFGESGTITELYDRFGFLPSQLVNSGLVAVNLISRDDPPAF